MKLAFVVWEDASELDTTTWTEHDAETFVYEPVICKQVGYILYNGDEGIVITDAVINSNGIVSRRSQIPRSMIKYFVWLEEPSFNGEE